MSKGEGKGTVGSNMTYQVTVQVISWPEAEEMKQEFESNKRTTRFEGIAL